MTKAEMTDMERIELEVIDIKTIGAEMIDLEKNAEMIALENTKMGIEEAVTTITIGKIETEEVSILVQNVIRNTEEENKVI